jgi:peptide/nickel transport system ATP-binding protein
MDCAISETPGMNEHPLLSVRDLSIRLSAGREAKPLVDSISFDVGAERVALVGESGSGKSLTARALMGLLRKPLVMSAGRLAFDGSDLLGLTPPQWAKLRGSSTALILQDPRHALNPVLTVGRQLDEMLLIHGGVSRSDRRDRVLEMLHAVGLTDRERVLRALPHQLSGGMGQRVMLAMMLINGPRLLIADEPTSALDSALRDQVLDLISQLVESRRMGLLLISHDLQQVSRYCERVLVMYRGRIIDRCAAGELANAQHPYTRTLWSCRPSGRTFGTPLPVLDRNWEPASVHEPH